jgi:hypothetical protein
MPDFKTEILYQEHTEMLQKCRKLSTPNRGEVSTMAQRLKTIFSEQPTEPSLRTRLRYMVVYKSYRAATIELKS